MSSEIREPTPAVRTKTKRRRYATFGLRVLFALTALCGCGLGYWTMPYTVVVEDTGPQVVVGGKAIKVWETKQNTPDDLYRREVRTVRRVFRGDPVRHGRTQVYNRRGTLVREENWRFGTLDGPFAAWDDNEDLVERGTYNSGVVDCRWVTQFQERRPEHPLRFDTDDRSPKQTILIVEKPLPRIRNESEYRSGLPVGKWRHFADGFLMSEEEFDNGVLIRETEFHRGPGGYALEAIERSHNSERTGGTLVRWFGDHEVMLEETPFRTILKLEGENEKPAVPRKIAAQRPPERYERHGSAHGRSVRGQPIYEGHWFADRPSGKWRYWNINGQIWRELEFENGVLLSADGKRMDDFTRRFHYYADSVSDNVLRTRLDTLVMIDLDEAPLFRLVDWLKSELPGIDVALFKDAEKAEAFYGVTVTLRGRDIPLGAALCLLLEPVGLTAVYRHEQLLIAKVADASRLADFAGITALRPVSGSKVERALTENTYGEFIEAPLKDVLGYYRDVHKIDISIDPSVYGDDDSSLALPTTLLIKGNAHSFRAVLGRLLEQHNLACEIRGDGLVVCRQRKGLAESPGRDK